MGCDWRDRKHSVIITIAITIAIIIIIVINNIIIAIFIVIAIVIVTRSLHSQHHQHPPHHYPHRHRHRPVTSLQPDLARAPGGRWRTRRSHKHVINLNCSKNNPYRWCNTNDA